MSLYILQCKGNNTSQITAGQFLDIVAIAAAAAIVAVIKCLIN
jgi:hypothetical protein